MISGQTNAHGIWFAQRSGELALIYGEGGDDLDTVKRIPLVKNFAAYDTAGLPVNTGLHALGKLVVVDLQENPALIAATLNNGIWTKSKEGHWYKKRRDQVPDAVSSSHNFKYAVHLRAPLITPPVLLEHQLQIIPISDIPNTKGKPLRLLVLYQGKPTSGIEVIADMVNDPDENPSVTGEDGIVSISVRNQGLNVIAAKLVVPSNDPIATEKIEHLATLSFRLAHTPE